MITFDKVMDEFVQRETLDKDLLKDIPANVRSAIQNIIDYYNTRGIVGGDEAENKVRSIIESENSLLCCIVILIFMNQVSDICKELLLRDSGDRYPISNN